jgi:lipoprotein
MKKSKKQSLIALFSLIVLSACLSSCQKSPINGNLDGQWQVMLVEPEPVAPDPMFNTRLYYCFYMHVCQLSIPGGVWIDGNMNYTGKKLSIDFPKELNSLELNALSQYGIDTNPIVFDIEHLDRKKLILRNGETVVTLRKF